MRRAIAALAALLVSACSGDGSGPPQEAAELAFTAQPSASTPGQVITPPVQVSVQDASGNSVTSGVNIVTLALGFNPSGATLSGTTTVGAIGGMATFSDLKISKPGSGYTLNAAATNLTSATSASFDVSPIPGLAVAMAPVAGDGQAATVGQAVATAPSVRVTDYFGDPVAHVGVTFSATAGGSVVGAEQTTDASGVATVGEWTLGTNAGIDTLLATSAGLEAVAFTAEATAGPATSLVVAFGDNQQASPGSPVVAPPAVIAVDSHGNGVVGITVTFAVTSGGGSLTGPVQATADNGVAYLEAWTLGPSAGPNTLTATAEGLAGSPITFTATAAILAATATVEVRNNYFSSVRNGSGSPTGPFGGEAVDTIGVGGTVTWAWVGEGHNVTPAFTAGNSETHDAPFTYSRTFSTPTNFYYRCTIHSHLIFDFVTGMRGVILVR